MPPAPPLPEEAIPRRRATSSRAVVAVLAGAVLVPVVAFAVTGTLLTVGIFVLPALAIAAILYLVWSARRTAERDTGLTENPEGSGAAPLGPRGGTYG